MLVHIAHQLLKIIYGAISSSIDYNQALVRFLRKDLHEGESETIALAVECDPDIVFLDESEARMAAGIYGLNKTGVIGILIRAKREGRISSLQDELDRLRNDAGFWIGEEIYRKALTVVGED
jgi:predicted nucleic acid-binding protein